jgi:hypothetical protein
VSCASAGDCAAGGFYLDGSARVHGFVVSKRNGRWGKAMHVLASGALDPGGYGQVNSVSCASAGNCAAGGVYSDGSHGRAFVVSERNGRWGKALEVSGSAAFNAGGDAEVRSVSCGAPGDCVAGGSYRVGSQAFVVSERNGRWGKALEVPGLGALNASQATVFSVSCSALGDCAAGGYYKNGSYRAFVVSERNGRWGKALEVPGSGALNAGRHAGVNSVSCSSAGNCAAGGFYEDSSHHAQAFVVSERNGRWGKALEVPGLGALNVDANANLLSVSCSPAGPCAAGGFYRDGSNLTQGFVVRRS